MYRCNRKGAKPFPNAQAVLQAILESLIAAILAYLSAHKAFEEVLGEVATALGELLPVLAAFLCLVIVLFFTWPLIVAIREAASAGVVVALAAALVVVIVTEFNKKLGDRQKVDPNNTPLTINLGPLSIQGITAVQISAFSRALDQGLQTFFRQGPITKTGDSAVPSV